MGIDSRISRLDFLKSMIVAGSVAAFPLLASAQQEKILFDGYWTTTRFPITYNAENYAGKNGGKDEWDGIEWNHNGNSKDYLRKDETKVEGGKVFFEFRDRKRYFKLEDLTIDPTEAVFWQLYINGVKDPPLANASGIVLREDKPYSSIYNAVTMLTSTWSDQRMTTTITNDILSRVPLEYFQVKGREKVTDKRELARFLTPQGIFNVLRKYTELQKH